MLGQNPVEGDTTEIIGIAITNLLGLFRGVTGNLGPCQRFAQAVIVVGIDQWGQSKNTGSHEPHWCGCNPGSHNLYRLICRLFRGRHLLPTYRPGSRFKPEPPVPDSYLFRLKPVCVANVLVEVNFQFEVMCHMETAWKVSSRKD